MNFLATWRRHDFRFSETNFMDAAWEALQRSNRGQLVFKVERALAAQRIQELLRTRVHALHLEGVDCRVRQAINRTTFHGGSTTSDPLDTSCVEGFFGMGGFCHLLQLPSWMRAKLQQRSLPSTWLERNLRLWLLPQPCLPRWPACPYDGRLS